MLSVVSGVQVVFQNPSSVNIDDAGEGAGDTSKLIACVPPARARRAGSTVPMYRSSGGPSIASRRYATHSAPYVVPYHRISGVGAPPAAGGRRGPRRRRHPSATIHPDSMARKKIACVVTEYRVPAHADVIIGKFLNGGPAPFISIPGFTAGRSWLRTVELSVLLGDCSLTRRCLLSTRRLPNRRGPAYTTGRYSILLHRPVPRERHWSGCRC